MIDKVTVAVYGSLMSGRHNHSMIEGGKLLGVSTLKAKMYSLGSYPAIVKGDDEHAIELYEVTDDMYLPVLSMEIGAGYTEEEQEFVVATGETITAKIFYAGEWLESYCEKTKKVIKSY